MPWVKPTTTIEMALGGKYNSHVLGHNPLVYLRMNERTGTAATDLSGNGRHGVYTNSPTLGRLGMLPDGDNAVLFDGSNDHITFATTGLNLTAGPLSVCAIIKPSGTPSAYQGILGTGTLTNMSGYGLAWDNGVTEGIAVNVKFFAGGQQIWIALPQSSTWQHVVGTWDGTTNTGQMKLYVNGVLVKQGAASTTSLSNTTFRVGYCGTNYFSGEIDEMFVCSSVLSQANITALYNATQWTDITDHLASDDIYISYGIKNHRPESRVAETGTIRFSLLTTPPGQSTGYYAINSANKRSGFDYRIPVRSKQVYGSVTRYKKGLLETINTEPGLYDGQITVCEALDWMDISAREDAEVSLQANVLSSNLFHAIVDSVSKQPAIREVATGVSTFTYAMDNISGDDKILTALNYLALSEYGLIACKRDSTFGETLLFESRQTRSTVNARLVTLDNTMHELELPGSATDILNSIKTVAFPRSISTSIVLAKIDSPIATPVQPGEYAEFFLDYTDPTQRDTKIGGINEITPVATTDYTMNTAVDGTGANATADFTVTIGTFGSRVRFRATNNGAVPAYIRTMQVRGDGIYSYNPITSRSQDADSIEEYDENVALIEMLYESNPVTSESIGAFILNIFKDPLAHVRVVRFVANQTDALLTAGISGEISDRVGVAETVNGLTAATEYHINGIEHEINEQEQVIVSWWLTPANTTRYWQIGLAGASELGVTTVLGV